MRSRRALALSLAGGRARRAGPEVGLRWQPDPYSFSLSLSLHGFGHGGGGRIGKDGDDEQAAVGHLR